MLIFKDSLLQSESFYKSSLSGFLTRRNSDEMKLNEIKFKLCNKQTKCFVSLQLYQSRQAELIKTMLIEQELLETSFSTSDQSPAQAA